MIPELVEFLHGEQVRLIIKSVKVEKVHNTEAKFLNITIHYDGHIKTSYGKEYIKGTQTIVGQTHNNVWSIDNDALPEFHIIEHKLSTREQHAKINQFLDAIFKA